MKTSKYALLQTRIWKDEKTWKYEKMKTWQSTFQFKNPFAINIGIK